MAERWGKEQAGYELIKEPQQFSKASVPPNHIVSLTLLVSGIDILWDGSAYCRTS